MPNRCFLLCLVLIMLVGSCDFKKKEKAASKEKCLYSKILDTSLGFISQKDSLRINNYHIILSDMIIGQKVLNDFLKKKRQDLKSSSKGKLLTSFVDSLLKESKNKNVKDFLLCPSVLNEYGDFSLKESDQINCLINISKVYKIHSNYGFYFELNFDRGESMYNKGFLIIIGKNKDGDFSKEHIVELWHGK